MIESPRIKELLKTLTLACWGGNINKLRIVGINNNINNDFFFIFLIFSFFLLMLALVK